MSSNNLLQWIRQPHRLLLFLLLFLYTLLFTNLAWTQHLSMRTHKADLGQIAQAIWNSSRGRFVEMTDNGFVASRLTDHVEPILLLVSPILWLWSDVRALLLLQVVFVAIGGWLFYELALVRLARIRVKSNGSRILTLALVIAYLLAPQLQAAVLTEFHAAPLSVPLILWAFWAIETDRRIQAVLAILLVAGVKEEMALLAAGLSGFAIYDLCIARRHDDSSRSRFILPLFVLLTIVCLAWFYITTFVIVPAHAVGVYGVEESVYLERYGALGNSPLDIIKSFVLRPGLVWRIVLEPARTHYLLSLIAGFGFLGLIAPEILILCLPLLFANLFSSYPPQYYGDFHYSAPLIPYMAVAATVGAARLWWILHYPFATSGGPPNPEGWTRAGSAIVVSILALILIGGAIGQYRQAGRGPWGGRHAPAIVTDHHRLLPRFVQQIPADAAVMATAAVHPHVALRRYVYQFPQGLDPSDLEPPNSNIPYFTPGQPPTWALLDVTTNTDMAPGDLKTRVDEMLAGEWGVVDGEDGFLLLRKGGTAKMIPDTFYDFARMPIAALGSAGLSAPSSLQLEQLEQGSLTYLDSEIEDWSLWRQSKVTTVWAVGKKFDPMGVEPLMELRTPNAKPFYGDVLFRSPSLIWYPATQWQPGEVIRVTTPWLYLPRFWGIALPESRVMSKQPTSPFNLFVVGDAFQRRADGRLAPINLSDHNRDNNADDDLRAFFPYVTQHQGRFQLHDHLSGQTIELSVDAWLPDRTWPHHTLDLMLRWQGAVWPEGLTVFVHLRQNRETLVQADGLPRWFVLPLATAQLTNEEVLYDWRQLKMPNRATIEEGDTWQVVIGLYDAQTGQRAELLDQSGQIVGNELIVGEMIVEEGPMPDLACAMIPLTCAAQPLKN